MQRRKSRHQSEKKWHHGHSHSRLPEMWKRCLLLEITTFSIWKVSCRQLAVEFCNINDWCIHNKINLVFKHMGMSIYTIRTYFNHQKDFIFPIVLIYWKIYRTRLMGKIKEIRDAVWCGDGHFDSLGHCASMAPTLRFPAV